MQRMNHILRKVLVFAVLGGFAFWRGCGNQGNCQVQSVSCGFNPCFDRVNTGNKKEPSLNFGQFFGSLLDL